MITQLEKKFEDLKEKFSKEQISLVFAKFESEKILEQTTLALRLLKNINDEDQMKKRFSALHKQAIEFDDLLTDLFEEKICQTEQDLDKVLPKKEEDKKLNSDFVYLEFHGLPQDNKKQSNSDDIINTFG